jgi:hypothetical protein
MSDGCRPQIGCLPFKKFCMNGNAILLATFSLNLFYSIPVSMSAAAGPASGLHSRLRNSDTASPSFFLRLPGRYGRSPCIHILYQAFPLTSIALLLIEYSISATFFPYRLQQEKGVFDEE